MYNIKLTDTELRVILEVFHSNQYDGFPSQSILDTYFTLTTQRDEQLEASRHDKS